MCLTDGPKVLVLVSNRLICPLPATMTFRSSLLLSRSRFCWSRTLRSPSGTSPLPPAWASRRYLSGPVKVRSYLQYVKRKVLAPPTPPYSHVCQIGDPVLRSRAAAVDPAAVTGPEVQEVLATMMKVMRKLECVGLSAPQVGVPLRILMLEVPWRRFEEVPAAAREARRLSLEPLRIFVNPELRVLDSRTVLFQEACESISGFSASVPRYLAVEVSGNPHRSWPFPPPRYSEV